MKSYECDGQMSLFTPEEELEYAHCTGCTNCTYKETFGEGDRLYFCGKHRTFITELTRPSWVIGCKGNDYQRRGNE